MDLMDLYAKLTLDTSDYESGIETASKSPSKISGAAVAAGKLAADAIEAAGKAAVGFAKDSFSVGRDFDTAMSQVAATMGKSVDEISDIEEAAKNFGATTQFTAKQAAEGFNYLALAGYDSETAINTLPTVLNLAAAGAMDLGAASDMVTDAMSALGLDTSDAEMMVDQMAKTASTTNTSVAQLGEAMLTVGATGRSLKGGTVELSTALGILANNGIKGAEGGTKLRNVIMSLTAPTDKAASLMEDLGVSAFESDGSMRQLDDILYDLNESMEGMSDADKTAIISEIFNKQDIAAV